MATIRDVARLANVSVATVSNALNNAERVSPELLARVRAAVDKLGYAPDAAARSLRKGASRLIGLIVGDITNPFFADLFEAVEDAAAARGYLVLLLNSNERVEREEAHLRMLRSQRIDGLILAPTGAVSMNRAALLAALEIPVVLVDRAMDGLGYDAVVLDNHSAGHAATSYILGHGHRRIGLINGPEVVRTAAGERYIPNFIENRLKFSPYIRNVAVIGAGRDLLTAIVCIDFDAVGHWAEERRISYTSYADLSQKPEVQELIGSVIAHVNTLQPEGLKVRRFVNLHKDFDADDGEITRTRKLRRNTIETTYAALIAALYGGERQTVFDAAITYESGERGVIRRTLTISEVPA